MKTLNKTMNEATETAMQKIVSGIITSISIEAILGTVKFVRSLGVSKIEVTEWDSAYDNINRFLYQLNEKEYNKFRLPTTNKESFNLTEKISYIIKLDKSNMVRVETSVEEANKLYNERRLRLTFIGKQKYVYRERFLKESLNLTDKDHILVQYLSEIKCNIIPHSFDNIVISPTIRNEIVKGLTNWAESKDWYIKHQLVHKIGVFLYGKPGTGKSTIARAISTMFGNAPILTIDPDNVMGSISDILRMRRKYNRTIIVLIEDFDMYFRKRSDDDEEENEESKGEKKKRKDPNQNAIFQLLDGVYSTDDTIYIATTNHKDKMDPGLIRYGRFDIQEELDYFDKDQALEFVKLLDYGEECLDSLDLKYPVQPSYLQSKVMEYRANNI